MIKPYQVYNKNKAKGWSSLCDKILCEEGCYPEQASK